MKIIVLSGLIGKSRVAEMVDELCFIEWFQLNRILAKYRCLVTSKDTKWLITVNSNGNVQRINDSVF